MTLRSKMRHDDYDFTYATPPTLLLRLHIDACCRAMPRACQRYTRRVLLRGERLMPPFHIRHAATQHADEDSVA